MASLPFDTQVFEYLNDAVVIVDDRFNVVFLNWSASKLYNISNEEALGRGLRDLFVEEWLNSQDGRLSVDSLAQMGAWSGKSYHIKRNKQKILVSSSVSALNDSSGQRIGTLFVIHQMEMGEGLDGEEHLRQRLDSLLSSDYDIDKEELASLIDVQALQSMVDDLYAVTRIGFAVIDLKGNVLASAGWSEICQKFHRVNPQSLWNCLESDLELTRNVARGEFKAYKCKNNMWDIVTPLVIGKKHVANIFSGQFFLDDEVVDRDLFAKQAEAYGFDKDCYLAALDKVPHWSKDVVESLMQFYVKLAGMISKLSYSNLKLSKSLLDQKSIEDDLREIQHDLNHAQEVARTGSWRLNARTNELLWSDETYRMFGIAMGKPMTYETFLECVHPDDRQLVDEKWKGALLGSEYDIEHRIVVGRRVLWVREKAELEFDSNGTLIGGFGTVQDITERKRNEEKLLSLNRQLRAISNSNQALMRAKDEVAFLQQGCRIIVEDCGYKLVWIGFAEADKEKTVKPMAYAGFDKGYIDSLRITWADTERGRGPSGVAIRTGKPQICRDMQTDASFAPWRQQALERGYASSIVLPLLSEGKAFGVLNIYSQDIDPFSDDEVKLLVELASDFAHGITSLRMRAAKERAERSLVSANELYRLALEASNLGAWDYHLDTGEVFWDERTRDMFGVSSGAVIKYADAIERIHPDDRFDVDEAVKEAISGSNKGEYNEEFRVVWPDGTIHWVLSHGKVHFVGDGGERKAVRFIGVNMDITERKEVEKALNKAKEEWDRTFESLPDLVMIVDHKHRILRINNAMAKRLDVKPELCFGKKCYQFAHGTDSPPDFCPHLKTLKDGQEHTAMIHEKKLCGEFLVSTTPLKDEEGKIIGSIHIARECGKRIGT